MCKNLKEKHTKTSPSALQCPENKTEAAGEANNTAQRVVYVNWTGEEAAKELLGEHRTLP